MTTLKAALQEAYFMELEEIPSEEKLSEDEALTFSSAFERKMKKLIRRADHPIRYRISQTAACLLLTACLAVVFSVALPSVLKGTGNVVPPLNPSIPGGGNISGENQGGTFTDGVDPIIESIAVYPETEDIRDVENATMESLDEITAYGMSILGNYLPTELPAGYYFDKADLYETTMKNGTQYHMLRITYAAGGGGIPTTPASDDSGVLAPDPNSFSSKFSVFVMDYEPRTKNPIYRFEDLPEFLESTEDIAVFHFSFEDVYIGFYPSELSTEEILTVVNSIPHISDKSNTPTE